MKKNKLALIVFFLLIVLLVPSFAQEETTDSIVLPDVTTIIDGNELEIDKEAIPDFSGALPDDLEARDSLPVLPSVTVTESPKSSFIDEKQEESRVVFVEGNVGFGWPYVFKSDFSVYRIDSKPFLLNFTHSSFGGYGVSGQETGFFNSETSVTGQKTFLTGNAKWLFDLKYVAKDLGLQGKSILFDDVNRRQIVLNASVGMPFKQHFEWNVGVNANWFSRYAGFVDYLDSVPGKESVALSFINLQGDANISWETQIIELSLDGLWQSNFFIGKENISSGRGKILFATEVSLQRFKIQGDVGAVFLPGGSGIEKATFTVPFSLAVTYSLPVNFSNSPFILNATGGIKSVAVDFALLEEHSPFTNYTSKLLMQNREESDWFVAVNLGLPIFSMATLDLTAEFNKTAFGNGVIETNFDFPIDSVTGFFYGGVRERTSFFTEAILDMSFLPLTASISWKANWLDIVNGELPHCICASVSLLSEKPWGVFFSVEEALGKNVDKVPRINAEAFIRPVEQIKIALSLEDAVKLFTSTNRVYAEPYINCGGSATVSVQFLY